ncbi:DUF3565 domain-containing protein [Rosistilla ulvae]|nr:DUF3565 domain-containing protein [Rosistilla ulvae]
MLLRRSMQQPIIGYHTDEEGDWVAQLGCGHNQHVRHTPPWMNRPWVTTAAGRAGMIGHLLQCKKCDEGAAADARPEAK